MNQNEDLFQDLEEVRWDNEDGEIPHESTLVLASESHSEMILRSHDRNQDGLKKSKEKILQITHAKLQAMMEEAARNATQVAITAMERKK